MNQAKVGWSTIRSTRNRLPGETAEVNAIHLQLDSEESVTVDFGSGRAASVRTTAGSAGGGAGASTVVNAAAGHLDVEGAADEVIALYRDTIDKLAER
jgi:hypothetical protein